VNGQVFFIGFFGMDAPEKRTKNGVRLNTRVGLLFCLELGSVTFI